MNVLDAKIIEGEAAPTYNKAGKTVAAGSLTSRVHFSIFGDTTRFDFTCIKGPLKKPGPFLPFQLNGEEIFISLYDCSDRLHISRRKLLAHKQNKTLIELFSKKMAKLQILNDMVESYSTIIKHYTPYFDTDFLIAKKDSFKIERGLLMKIIHIYHQKLLQKEKMPFEITLSKKTQKKYRTKLSNFLVHDDPGLLIDLTTLAVPISGASATVSRVNEISHGIFLALKESNEDEAAVLEALSELQNINFLKSLNLTENIVIPYLSQILRDRVRVIGPYCNKRDCIEAFRYLDASRRVQLIAKPLNGLIATLKSWHENRITHGDLKPENIFVHEDHMVVHDQSIIDYKLYFGDLGGLHQASGDDEIFEINAYTPNYCLPCYSNEKMPLNRHLSRDVFGLGMTITSIFTDLRPYQEDNKERSFPNFSYPFCRKALLKVCSSKATSLLQAMCHPLTEKRLTIHEVHQIVSDPDFQWGK